MSATLANHREHFNSPTSVDEMSLIANNIVVPVGSPCMPGSSLVSSSPADLQCWRWPFGNAVDGIDDDDSGSSQGHRISGTNARFEHTIKMRQAIDACGPILGNAWHFPIVKGIKLQDLHSEVGPKANDIPRPSIALEKRNTLVRLDYIGDKGSFRLAGGYHGIKSNFLTAIADACASQDKAMWLSIWKKFKGSLTVLLEDTWPDAIGRWATTENQVKEWGRQTNNASDEGGILPNESMINSALSFLARAKLAEVAPPNSTSIDADGEIAFFWTNGPYSASACFPPDGHIVGYANTPGENALFKIDEKYHQNLVLKNFFQQINDFA